MSAASRIRLAIDGSNLRQGGGITHLTQLLAHVDPPEFGFGDVTVWGPVQLLDSLPERPWLNKLGSAALEQNLLARVQWQMRDLSRWCTTNADLLFVPGGQYLGGFRPFVTMCRNMIPFDAEARRLYGASRIGLRLRALRWLQVGTFRRASGVIFLTDAARVIVTGIAGPLPAAVIPHGIAREFRKQPREQMAIETYSEARPFRWLYVSIIDLYKHQHFVADAAARLRQQGYPLMVDFVGPAYPPALDDLDRVRSQVDPGHSYLRHLPAVQHHLLPRYYFSADAFIFASSCENMPNILLEAMAAGLPIACSHRQPMPQILGEGGLYFEPTDAASIAAAMANLMADTSIRSDLAEKAFARAAEYTWERCARETFAYLQRTIKAAGAEPVRAA